MNKKNLPTAFARALPRTTSVLEKPMAQWASGKIKRLYNGYESFCQEIGRLLGEPSKNLTVCQELGAHMIDEFDLIWENQKTKEQNTHQLLTLLSNFYKAGFIVNNYGASCQVKSYFLENSQKTVTPSFDQMFKRFTPPLKEESAQAQPLKIQAQQILKTLGLRNLDWEEESVAIHFWLYPQESVSLVLMTNSPEPLRHEIVLKTRALIQRRFYVEK